MLPLGRPLLPLNSKVSLPNTRQFLHRIFMIMRQMEESDRHQTLLDCRRLVARPVCQQRHESEQPRRHLPPFTRRVDLHEHRQPRKILKSHPVLPARLVPLQRSPSHRVHRQLHRRKTLDRRPITVAKQIAPFQRSNRSTLLALLLRSWRSHRSKNLGRLALRAALRLLRTSPRLS